MNIEITEHSPYWKLYYAKEEQRILKELKLANISTRIAHIGSTAVPNLSAKPTIDILLGLRKETDLDGCITAFQKLGYIYVSKYNEEMPFRRFFIKIKALNALQKWDKKEIGMFDAMPLRQSYLRVFHVHVVQQDTLFYKQHLAFRNCLREHEGTRLTYEHLKKHLAQLDWDSENDYAHAKGAFIKGVLDNLKI